MLNFLLYHMQKNYFDIFNILGVVRYSFVSAEKNDQRQFNKERFEQKKIQKKKVQKEKFEQKNVQK